MPLPARAPQDRPTGLLANRFKSANGGAWLGTVWLSKRFVRASFDMNENQQYVALKHH